MFLISKDFGNHTIPEIVTAEREAAEDYVRENETVFCSYKITEIKVLHTNAIEIMEV